MLKKLSLFILLLQLFIVSPALAQDADTMDTAYDDYDTSQSSDAYEELQEQSQNTFYSKDSVDGQALDSATWKNLTKDLNYGDTLDHQKKQTEKTNKGEENKSWDFSWFKLNSEITKYVLFALVIAGIAYLLYRLIGSALFIADPKIKKAQATFEILHDDEKMMQNELDSILEEALKQKDYKTAIRIVFIQSLQDLQAYEWIKWKKEKTNRDYLNELSQRDAFVPFGSMIVLYEKAWYSQFSTTEEDYLAFNTFKQQIKRV